MRVRMLLVAPAVIALLAAGTGGASAAPIPAPNPGCVGEHIREDVARGFTPAELGEGKPDGVFSYIYSVRSVCPHVIPPKSRHS